MNELEDHINSLKQELRRGVVVLAVLGQLSQPRYGYDLIRLLGERGLDLEEGTLYPLLRRLEKQGLLQSNWEITEARPRKYYQLNDYGRSVLASMLAEWHSTVRVMEQLMSAEQEQEQES
ncbi:MAG: PadR family transcriptional regulator [Anaerolineae bacterium]|nr:PadR family transcriptional regulator [Anaerolineae bacterium]